MAPLFASAESKVLAAGVELLRPLFVERGFSYHRGTQARSSGGPFATGHFRKGDIEVGLIVRNNVSLGCPNYSTGHGYAGHNDMVRALGHEGQEHLVQGEFLEFKGRNGGDPFDAFKSDLDRIIFPEFDQNEGSFRDAVANAVRYAHARLGF